MPRWRLTRWEFIECVCVLINNKGSRNPRQHLIHCERNSRIHNSITLSRPDFNLPSHSPQKWKENINSDRHLNKALQRGR